MITVEEAMHVLYTQLCTQPYRATSHYTVTDYSNDPLLESQPKEFKTEVLLGPAAKVYTPSGLIPK
jgi:hypothetical protein